MTTTLRCGICGGDALLVTEPREIPIGKRVVTIDDRFYRCLECGETFYVGDMPDQTLRRASAKIRAEDGLLSPDEIRAIRAKYGLSQAALEQLIGAGEKTVVRWERGTIAQNAAADTLLRVLRDHPAVVADLARERGVRLAPPAGEAQVAA